MTRYHATPEGDVPFSAAEEIAYDQEMVETAARIAAEKKVQLMSTIKAEMDKADLKIIRALIDGDTAKIKAHKIAQAARRAKLT